jgi:hypothetical protein
LKEISFNQEYIIQAQATIQLPFTIVDGINAAQVITIAHPTILIVALIGLGEIIYSQLIKLKSFLTNFLLVIFSNL